MRFETFEKEVPHKTVLHKQNQNCFLKNHQITFYTANSYHSTNLIQYEGLGVSHFAAFFSQHTDSQWHPVECNSVIPDFATLQK